MDSHNVVYLLSPQLGNLALPAECDRLTAAIRGCVCACMHACVRVYRIVTSFMPFVWTRTLPSST